MNKKTVLGIYGSPRPGGNSDLLLNTVLEGARAGGARVDTVYVRDLKFAGCRECGGCDRDGKCVVRDDMQEIYPLLKKAQTIFLASPVFFYGFPAGLKALIDRAQAFWAQGQRSKVKDQSHVIKTKLPAPSSKAGYLLAVGATRGKNLFSGMELTARYFFDTLDLSYRGGLLIREAEGKGTIENRPGLVEQARDLGRKAAESR